MAGEYSYLSGLEVTATKSGKVLKLFFIFTIMCLSGELIWLLGIGPFRPFSRVDIIGAENVAREEILIRAGFTAGLSFITADVGAMEKALAGIVSIESVRVFKHLPGRLQIILQERQPVASAFVNLDGRAVPILFDSQGVIYQIGSEKKNEFLSGVLPVISGLEINAPYLGEKLPDMYIPLLEDIEHLRISNPNLLKMISEIKINQKSFDSFDLILYPVHKKIRVRLSELNEDRLQYNLLFIDLMSDESGIDIFDSRSGIASYIPKEASPE
jgi:cell division protein FtsQ